MHGFDPSRPDHEDNDRAHDRIERRRYWVRDIPAGRLTGGFARATQVVRIERTTTRDGRTTTKVVYAITSRPRKAASARQLASFIRGHWSIENRLHYVRDVTFDEDRSRVRTKDAPRVLATLRNTAIAIIRLAGFANVPKGIRRCCFDLRYLVGRLAPAAGHS
jgi:predicted transposase YbfD/YdcC